ncbi:hypothetical protein QUF80_14110 [Desulfococcaceae bacterium HSG8]|nr:hypothetical protein [Desulfococcaceae bacterium HSG8]
MIIDLNRAFPFSRSACNYLIYNGLILQLIRGRISRSHNYRKNGNVKAGIV